MSQTRKVRAAAVQIAPDLTSGVATLDRVIAAIDDAGGKGAEFIVFPETFVSLVPVLLLRHAARPERRRAYPSL